MAKSRYLVSTKKPGLEFRVVKVEPIAGDTAGSVRASLVGAHGVQFDKVINEEILGKYGYVIQVREDAGTPVSPA